MKIYTKVGDGGNTFLIGGRSVSKTDPIVEALGDVDELNAGVGGAASLIRHPDILPILNRIQNTLHVLGADIAAVNNEQSAPKTPRITPDHAAWAEREIDALTQELPPLSTFILPGGSPAAASLHVARAVCRRAERKIAALHKKKRTSKDVLIFLNRLSDLLFLIARRVNSLDGHQDIPWKI